MIRGRRAGARTAAIVAAALAPSACGGPANAGPALRTMALTAPELTEPAFEPHLSIDPGDPDRIIVAAHYGVGYNRGGRKIWTWRTSDGGRTWTGRDMPLPAPTAGLAADAVTAFGPDGTAHLLFLFADTAGLRFNGGAALTRDATAGGDFGPARVVAHGGLDSPAAAAVDKGWLAIDRGVASPLRGTVYLTWHLNRPDPDRRTVHSSLWLAASRGGDGRFTEPVKVADAFHGQVAVRPDGTVDVIYARRGRSALQHATSIDGGRTFSPPDTVATLGDSVTIDVPHLTATGGSRLLVCWSEASRSDSTRYVARCARSLNGVRWEPPAPVVPDLPPASSVGFPVTAGDGDAVWMLAYRADADTTRVILLESSDGGGSFELKHELARRPPGVHPVCLAAGAPCRRAADAFFPGDYFGLAAVPGRVAAAYVLPHEAHGRATVYVSILRR